MRMTMMSMQLAVIGTEVFIVPCFQIVFMSSVDFLRLRGMTMAMTVATTAMRMTMTQIT